MALTPVQIQQLNAAAARIAAGTGSATDRSNVGYATRRYGFQYNPGTVTSSPVSQTPMSPAPAPAAPAPQTRAVLEPQGYKYIGPSGLQAAVQQYGQSRVKNIAGNYYVIPSNIQNPNPSNPIPANQLSSGYGDLSSILGANVGPDTVSSDIAGLLALYGKETESQRQYDEIGTQLTDMMGKIGGQAADFQAELERQGVPQAYQQLRELNLRGAQLQGELQKFDAETEQFKSNIEGQAIPTGLILGQQGQLQKQRDLTRMAKAAELGSTVALAQAYQGNAELGSQLAQQAVDMKYQPIINNIEVLKTQLGLAGEKMSREDRNRFSIIDKLYDAKLREIQEKKDKENDIMSIAVEAASAGAPLSVVNQIKSSLDLAGAAAAAGKWSQSAKSKQEIVDLAAQAAQNGAPADVVARIRKAKDMISASQAFGTWAAAQKRSSGGKREKEYKTLDEFIAQNKSRYPLADNYSPNGPNQPGAQAQYNAAKAEYDVRVGSGQFLGPQSGQKNQSAYDALIEDFENGMPYEDAIRIPEYSTFRAKINSLYGKEDDEDAY